MIRIIYAVLILVSGSICNAQTPLWQPTGPLNGTTGFQGSTADSSGNLFVGSEDGPVFRSTDKGQTWEIVHYFTYGVLHLGTDQNGDVFTSDYLGVLRTTDAGTTWKRIINGLPSGEDAVYCTVGDSEFLAGTYPPGLYRTTDRGEDWIGIPGTTNRFGRIGAIAELPPHSILVGSIDSGLFRSTDDGVSWSKINSFPLDTDSWIRAIKVLGTGRILVATDGYGLYQSDDIGSSWTCPIAGQFLEAIGTTGLDTVYTCALGGGVYRSTDNGDSWEQYGFGSYNQGSRSMVCSSNGDVFVFATTGGFVRRAGSSSWSIMPIPSAVVSCMASSATNIYVGAASGGFFCTTDGGRLWSESSLSEPFDIKVDKAGNLLAAVKGSRIWKSTNNGGSWYQVLNATPSQPDGYSIAIDSSGGIYVGVSGDSGRTVFKSTDNCGSWQEMDDGLGNGPVLSLLLIKDNVILAAEKYSGIYRSANGGGAWGLSSAGLPSDCNFVPSALVEDDSGRIYCGTMTKGVFLSVDDGLTWQPCNSGIPSPDILNIIALGQGRLLAATAAGVFRSTDNGSSWESYNSGITSQVVNAFAVDSYGYVYAGTDSFGVFKSGRSLTSMNSSNMTLPTSFRMAAYPNPFNPSTTIEYSIARTGFINISVYNVIGERVATLVNGRLRAGDYQVQWRATHLASGTYFCRIEAEGFAKTIKLMLLK